jgi:hypothetical protein
MLCPHCAVEPAKLTRDYDIESQSWEGNCDTSVAPALVVLVAGPVSPSVMNIGRMFCWRHTGSSTSFRKRYEYFLLPAAGPVARKTIAWTVQFPKLFSVDASVCRLPFSSTKESWRTGSSSALGQKRMNPHVAPPRTIHVPATKSFVSTSTATFWTVC